MSDIVKDNHIDNAPKWSVRSTNGSIHETDVGKTTIQGLTLGKVLRAVNKLNELYSKQRPDEGEWKAVEIYDETGLLVWEKGEEICPDCDNAVIESDYIHTIEMTRYRCSNRCGYDETS